MANAVNIKGDIHLPGLARRKPKRSKGVRKDAAQTLFASRPLMNAHDLIAWAKDQGFATTQLPEDMHVTLAYSKQPMSWPDKPDNSELAIPAGGERHVMPLGSGGAVVLRFDDPEIEQNWQKFIDQGASWDFDSYHPHVTITWHCDQYLDLSQVEPYSGPLIFGPEEYKPISDDWQSNHIEKADYEGLSMKKYGARHSAADKEILQTIHDKSVALGAQCSGEDYDGQDEVDGEGDDGGGDEQQTTAKFFKSDVVKVDADLGLVFGLAMVCKVDGQDFYDSQGDHIPEGAMLKASADFMQKSRVAREMHTGEPTGTVVFAFPMTTEIAKSLDITLHKTGLLIAMKPDSRTVLEKFRSGEYTGFSIGGRRIKDKAVDA